MELTLGNIVKACKGKYFGDHSLLDQNIENVTTDSREVVKDSLFIAFKGLKVDGHSFIEGAFRSGAVCCISEHEIDAPAGAVIVVESSYQALRDIAAFYRSTLNIPVIGITGSVGKTGTKEMIASVLSQKFNVHKTEKNYNNDIGLPQTLLKIRSEHEIAVVEMGINHFGEMRVLAEIARPNVVVMTNIGPCHLENLIDLDGVLRAKSEVFEYVNPEGAVFLNGDEPPLCEVKSANGIKPVFFGFKTSLDYYADHFSRSDTEGSSCMIHNGSASIPITINAPGKHMVYHALAAAAVGKYFGLFDEDIHNGISAIRPESGRNNLIHVNGITLIDGCYNASPVSMKSSVDILSAYNGRKICILGDMFELGKNSEALHFEVGEFIAGKNIDLLLTAGTLAENIARGASENESLEIISYETKEALIKDLTRLIKAGDTILLKASHGMHFDAIIQYMSSQEFHPL